MTKPDIIEIMARAMCISGGFWPDGRMPNDGPRWRYYVPGLQAALSALHEAGFVVVPKEGVIFGTIDFMNEQIAAAQVPHD